MWLLSALGSRLLLVAATRGPGRPGLRRYRQGGLACLASDRARGQGAGRAEITGSREGAKPRSSDGKKTIFRQSPRATLVEPFLGKGHPGSQPSSARRARLPGKRSGSGGRSGLRARWNGNRNVRILRAVALRNDRGFLLLLADNYNHKTNDPTAETQSAQRTHRDFFSRAIR